MHSYVFFNKNEYLGKHIGKFCTFQLQDLLWDEPFVVSRTQMYALGKHQKIVILIPLHLKQVF